MFALYVHSNRTHFNQESFKTNSTGWAKDGQSSHLIKPSLHLMTVKFNSTGEAQNMSLKRNKNKTEAKSVLSLRSTLTNILQIT